MLSSFWTQPFALNCALNTTIVKSVHVWTFVSVDEAFDLVCDPLPNLKRETNDAVSYFILYFETLELE